MILALAILAGLAAFVAFKIHRQNRRDRQWRDERARLEAYGERLAASNGHPDGDIVAIAPTRPRDPYRHP